MSQSEETAAEGLQDWRATMPVWAMLDLIRLRPMWASSIESETTPGRVLAGRLVVAPPDLQEGLPADRYYLVRVEMRNGRVRDLYLWDNRHKAVMELFNDLSADPPGPYPDDEVTGWPDHYIVNGDPASCGCPEHVGLISMSEEDI